MRYLIHNHPAFPGPVSKEDLYVLVERGSLARGDLCTDRLTGRDHTVGDVIGGMRRPRASSPPRIDRPAYREIRADAPPDIPDDEEMGEDDGEPEDLMDDDAAEEEGEEAEEPDPGEEPAYTPAGELILYQSHPSWLGYGKALLLVLLLIVAAGMLLRFEADYAIVSLLCASATFTCVAMARFTRDYLVTEARAEVIWGIFGRSSKEMPLASIRTMDVHQKGLKGMLGLARVDFFSAAGSAPELQFRDIRGAHDLKQLIRQVQLGKAAAEEE